MSSGYGVDRLVVVGIIPTMSSDDLIRELKKTAGTSHGRKAATM